MVRILIALLALTLGMPGTGSAAELLLSRERSAPRPIVTLGDVAEVLQASAEERAQLAAIELFPAPQAGQKRVLTARELRDMLQVHGVNLVEHRLSGSSQVIVTAATIPAPAKESKISTNDARRLQSQVEQAIASYLEQKSGERGWEVAARLDESATRSLQNQTSDGFAIRGGQAPWVGEQAFEVVGAGAEQAAVRINAQATLPSAVVIAIQPIERGARIGPADVAMQRTAADQQAGNACQKLEEVLGCEATRPIAAGTVLDQASVRQPLLVRRGDLLTVFARSAGVQVRTQGKALGDGSQGQVVEVEVLGRRDSFFARVSGYQQVEVYGRATNAGPATAVR